MNGTKKFGSFGGDFGHNTIAIKFNSTVLLGTTGKVCLYSNGGVSSDSPAGDFEKELCADVASNTDLEQYVTSQTKRRKWSAPPLRRGVLQTDKVHGCNGGCVWTSGEYLYMKVPQDSGVMNPDHRYRGSMDGCAVTSTEGACAPQTTPGEWEFTTGADPTVLNYIPGEDGVCDGFFSIFCDMNWWELSTIICGILTLCLLALLAFKRDREKEQQEEDYKRFSFDDFDSEYEELFGDTIYGEMGAGPGKSMAIPRGPDHVPLCEDVDSLNVMVEATKTAMTFPDQEDRNSALQKVIFEELISCSKKNPYRSKS